MVYDLNTDRLAQELKLFGRGEILCYGGLVQGKISEAGDEVSLTALLFSGSNYIPHSIRSCLKVSPPMPVSAIITYITVDESEFEICLKWEGSSSLVDSHEFSSIVSEFGTIAEEWRLYIDENDRRDLVYANRK